MLAVSGGKSPEALFQRLSAMLLPWRRVKITLVDERFVPPEHADSNERLVRAALLQGKAAQATWLPLYQAGVTIEDAATTADRQLREWSLPFDAVVLGMGDDGHTASWFPDALELLQLLQPENTSLVAVAHPQKAPHPRLTLTRNAVLNSRLIQLLIPGASKQPVYQRAKMDAEPITELPVRAVLHQQQVPVHVYRTQ
jgi:6-phosphogluconolactonase